MSGMAVEAGVVRCLISTLRMHRCESERQIPLAASAVAIIHIAFTQRCSIVHAATLVLQLRFFRASS